MESLAHSNLGVSSTRARPSKFIYAQLRRGGREAPLPTHWFGFFHLVRLSPAGCGHFVAG